MRNEIDKAEAALRTQLQHDPKDKEALQLYSQLAARRGDTATAYEYLRSVIDLSIAPSAQLLSQAAELAMASGQPYDSVDFLVRLNENYPENVEAKYDLIGLSAMVGLTHLGLPHLQWLAQRGQVDLESLQVLADPLRVQPDGELSDIALRRCPTDLRNHYGKALLDASNFDWQSVLDRLEPVLKKHGDFAPAFALYGRAIMESGLYDLIPSWQESLPENIETSSQYWVAAGIWAQQKGSPAEAAHAFGRALQADQTTDPRALQGLASSLRRLGRDEDADFVTKQLNAFSKMRDALKTFLDRESESQQAALAVGDSMVLLGRLWEAEAWLRLSAPLPNDRMKDLRERHRAVRSRIDANTPWKLAEQQLVSVVDYRDFPAVRWSDFDKKSTLASNLLSGNFQFQDQAKQRGLIHTCDIAAPESNDGHWIYQTVGGGISVLDFDLDGMPDLAAARLNGQPKQRNSSPNRLFRNQGGLFQDVSISSQYQDTGFSHGIAVGDYNSDGFPDLYDANFGHNRLYRNNGDGTYSDVTDDLGDQETHWTTSAVIADIDGDAIADLFDVAYCDGEASLANPCYSKSGRLMTCSPLTLPAKSDSFFSGGEDGRFENRNLDWLGQGSLGQGSPGRGLGLVVGQLDQRPGFDVYVANDMTANHLWSTQKGDDDFRMADLGVLSGVGTSGSSLSQASMGIAAADPDRDGDIDFFLTHFLDDHNTYYEQVQPGTWVDRSYQSGLSEPSIKMLGFGTQWIDFDNNGMVELIVANGHVDDFDQPDKPYEMPTQLFSLGDDGRWFENDSDRLGDYFKKLHLGRALASVDINRDGLTDVVITHLEEPVSLLVNQTPDSGSSIELTFKSVESHRDAIGTRVTVELNGEKSVYHLLAGDGYMCSNQRVISIGTGGLGGVENVTVTWPSGTEQSLGDLVSGRHYLIVEGEAAAFELGKHRGN